MSQGWDGDGNISIPAANPGVTANTPEKSGGRGVRGLGCRHCAGGMNSNASTLDRFTAISYHTPTLLMECSLIEALETISNYRKTLCFLWRLQLLVPGSPFIHLGGCGSDQTATLVDTSPRESINLDCYRALLLGVASGLLWRDFLFVCFKTWPMLSNGSKTFHMIFCSERPLLWRVH